jgi:hypothetical protein
MAEIMTVSRVVGLFADPDVFLRAAAAARKKGWKNLDAVTPYPLHGTEHALGLKMSWVPYVTLTFGLLGAVGGYLLQAWTLAVDWPVNIGGKPYLAWQAYIPITFESGILIGGLATFIAMWMACKLPQSNPVILDPRLTEDHFAIMVPVVDGEDESEISQFLRNEGAEEVRRVEM